MLVVPFRFCLHNVCQEYNVQGNITMADVQGLEARLLFLLPGCYQQSRLIRVRLVPGRVA